MESTKLQPVIPSWKIEARQRERKANKMAKNKRQEQSAKQEVNQWWKQPHLATQEGYEIARDNEGEDFA